MGQLTAATYLAPCNRPLYEYVATSLGASDLVDGVDWRDLGGGGIELAFVCSPPVTWLQGRVETIGAPVLTDPRFKGLPLYTSEVVVHRDSDFSSIEDLRGARWAINEPSSWSGYWVTLQRVGSWSFFGEVLEAGFHQHALRMVADGRADGAAIDCQVLAVELRDSPSLGDSLRTVETLGPAPSQPVVVRSDLPSGLKAELRDRLLELRGDVLARHFVERFAPAPDYSSIAAVAGAGVGQYSPSHISRRTR